MSFYAESIAKNYAHVEPRRLLLLNPAASDQIQKRAYVTTNRSVLVGREVRFLRVPNTKRITHLDGSRLMMQLLNASASIPCSHKARPMSLFSTDTRNAFT